MAKTRRSGLVLLLLVALVTPVLAESDRVPVAVAQPRDQSSGEILRLSGAVTAKNIANLSPRVDGLVAEVVVDAGSEVAAGDRLLQLDATLARLDLELAQAAEAEAAAASAEAGRLLAEARRLREQQHISVTEVASREAAAAQADAAHAAARARKNAAAEMVRRHLLPAPFAGVVSRRFTAAGEWVSRGTPVFELVALSPVQVDVMAPQERFAELAVDTQATVYPDARPGRGYAARVADLVPVSDQSRSFLVRLVVEDAGVDLLPGTSAAVEFRLGNSGQPGLLVPRDALLRHPDGGQSLFVVEDGVARRRTVAISDALGGNILVTSGIAPGEPVIVRGNELVRDGQGVTITSGTE